MNSSIDAKSKNACVFCKIVESGKGVFRQTKNTVTFLSNPSLVKGHTLVVPKKHYESLSDIPRDVMHELIDETVAVQKLVVERLKFQGCDINQHYTPFAPENRLKVHHVHFHIVPRNFNDDLYLLVNKHKEKIFRDLGAKELAEVENLLN